MSLVTQKENVSFSESTAAQHLVKNGNDGPVRVRGIVLSAPTAQVATLQSASDTLAPFSFGAGKDLFLGITDGIPGDEWFKTAKQAQVSTLTVDTAADEDVFTITVGGLIFTGTSDGTDASAQATAIRALMSANAEFLRRYTVGGAGADVVVTALVEGKEFVVTETVEATSAYSWALTTAPGEALNITLANAVQTDGVIYFDTK